MVSRRARLIKERGFTLTEIAIVLGIIGLVLGGIWTATANVYEQMRARTAERDIAMAFDNAKKLYQGQVFTGMFSQFTVEVGAGMFNSDFTLLDTPSCGFQLQTQQQYAVTWDGYYPANFWGDATAAPTMVYEMDLAPLCYDAGAFGAEASYPAIPEDMCIKIVTDFSRMDGIVDIYTDKANWGPVYSSGWAGSGSDSTMAPIPPAAAALACSGTLDLWIVMQVPG